jgi:hypothetical protein
MRPWGSALLAAIVIGGAAVAGHAASPADGAGSGTPDLSGITFNLAAPDYGKVERLPDAAQLRDLSAEPAGTPVASATPRRAPKPAAKPVAPPPAPRPRLKAAAAPIPALGPDGKPISAWRRAYILKHGHQPPAPGAR